MDRILANPGKDRSDDLMKILADPLVEQVNQGRSSPPADWVSRRLYANDDRARTFLEASADPTYHASGLQELCRRAVSQVRARTVVSFGPGDGRFDTELVQILKQGHGAITYIPVDISRVILEAAGAIVGRVATVPVGLLVDFEQEGDLLRVGIARHASTPVLFSMLGGTIANLDSGATRFFAMVGDLMQPGDSFMVDLPLFGPAWRADRDPRLNSLKYRRSFKRFLAGGLISREPELVLDDVADWFDDRIECLIRPGREIEHTKHFQVVDRRTGCELVSTRLYDWQSIQDWFEAGGFEILLARSTLTSANDALGMGVVVISRRSADGMSR